MKRRRGKKKGGKKIIREEHNKKNPPHIMEKYDCLSVHPTAIVFFPEPNVDISAVDSLSMLITYIAPSANPHKKISSPGILERGAWI